MAEKDYKAFDKDLHQVLKEMRKIVTKITKNLKDVSLDYNVQFAIDSVHPDRYIYAAWIQPPNNRTSRIDFLAKSTKDLIDQMEKFSENVDDIAVEVVWHRAEIEACQETIKSHQERIDQLIEEKTKRVNGEKENV